MGPKTRSQETTSDPGSSKPAPSPTPSQTQRQTLPQSREGSTIEVAGEETESSSEEELEPGDNKNTPETQRNPLRSPTSTEPPKTTIPSSNTRTIPRTPGKITKPQPPEDPKDPRSSRTMTSNMPDVKGFKPASPKPYGGTKGEDLEGFLVQARVHIKWYQSSLPDEHQKVMAISQYLTNQALIWMTPILQNFLSNTPGTANEITTRIFGDYAQFEEGLRAKFGDKNRAQNAEKQLYKLKQTKSAAEYAVEFQTLAIQSGLPEAALFTPFYNGLKLQVKDELYKIDRPEKFEKYVDMAITMDQRSFERYLEKKGSGRTSVSKNTQAQNKKKDQKEANATSSVDKKDKSQVECFNCGKKGHYKSSCDVSSHCVAERFCVP